MSENLTKVWYCTHRSCNCAVLWFLRTSNKKKNCYRTVCQNAQQYKSKSLRGAGGAKSLPEEKCNTEELQAWNATIHIYCGSGLKEPVKLDFFLHVQIDVLLAIPCMALGSSRLLTAVHVSVHFQTASCLNYSYSCFYKITHFKLYLVTTVFFYSPCTFLEAMESSCKVGSSD